MSEHAENPARPVSLFTIVLLLAVSAAFLVVVRYLYHPAPIAVFNAAPDNLSKDWEWRATAVARRKALADLREKETQQASSYAWIDQKAGIVQLPIERAMELTARQYSAKK